MKANMHPILRAEAPLKAVSLAACFVFGASLAQGAVTTEAWYRIGDDDSSATSGGVISGIEHVAESGGTPNPSFPNPLPAGGSPEFTTDTPLTATSFAMDSLSTGENRNTGIQTFNFTDNFGVEGWFKFPVTGGDNVSDDDLVVAGNFTDGWGITARAGNPGATGVVGYVAGEGFTGEANIVANQWTHLAFVVEGGTGTLYQDGSAISPTVSVNNPIASFSSRFKFGQVEDTLYDEIRVFSFASGQFSTSDLLLNDAAINAALVPEPRAAGLLLGAGALFFATARSRGRR